MTIAPLPPGNSVYYGPNGILLAGGLITSYIPRTTVFKSTWADPAQVTLNSNPLTLPSNASAILYGLGALRQIVQDSLGDTIWDSPTWGGGPTLTAIVLASGDGGVWTAPPGVYWVYVEAVGAGGSGSNCTAGAANGDVSGSGGGAGGFANGIFATTPGRGTSYAVGIGGAIGLQTAGTSSSFGAFIHVGGGKGGSFGSQGTSVGGVGGSAVGGTIMNMIGGAGTDGSHIPSSGGRPYIGAGLGGTSFYGAGGTSSNGATGNNGLAPGSGGGGVMDVNLTSTVYNGGAGADGQILIYYWS